MKIDCSQFAELKEAYVDGLLSPDATASIGAHVAGCARCSHSLAMAKMIQADMRTAVKSAIGRPVQSPARIAALYAGLYKPRAHSPHARLGRASFPMAMLTLMLAVSFTIVAAQAGFFMGDRTIKTPNNQNQDIAYPQITIEPT